MASKNKNTKLNYGLEKRSQEKIFNERLYAHSSSGNPYNVQLPGLGFGNGRLYSANMLRNHIDVESALMNIGSCNLEEEQQQVTPYFNRIETMDLFEQAPVYMPKPLVIQRNQRPIQP